MIAANKNAFQQDAYHLLVDHTPLFSGGIGSAQPPRMQTPSGGRPPPLNQTPLLDSDPPECRPPGHVTCDVCWKANLPLCGQKE